MSDLPLGVLLHQGMQAISLTCPACGRERTLSGVENEFRRRSLSLCQIGARAKCTICDHGV